MARFCRQVGVFCANYEQPCESVQNSGVALSFLLIVPDSQQPLTNWSGLHFIPSNHQLPEGCWPLSRPM